MQQHQKPELKLWQLPLDVEVAIRNLECSIQEALGGRNLSHLPARTHG
jgi:hypothetical protein